MSAAFDALVVGAGHNGLVCAAYLARSGRRVLVLEASAEVGGAAQTIEIAPGYRVSACAHILHLLHPRVSADLRLDRHGLELSVRHMASVALSADGQHIVLSGDEAATARSVAAHSAADALALPRLRSRLLRFSGALQPFLAAVPPRLGSGLWSDRIGLGRLGLAVRRLGREDMREFLRMVGMNVADLLEEELETEPLRGALALDAVLGTRMGPRSPNTVLTLLYRLAGETAGVRGALGHPRGGMGALSRALATAARAAGAEIRTSTPVRRILVEGDRPAGIELESGERIKAATVVSNADPQSTFLNLLGAEHLDTGFVRRVKNIRMRGAAAKLHLALDGLPTFRDLDGDLLGARMVVAPSIAYVERAFDDCKYGEYSRAPAIEITIPSVHDQSLAPAGKHVLSAIVQYAPHDLKQGWDRAREAFADDVVTAIARYAPDLKKRIVARHVLTPLDLERNYRMTGGHWHHGELAIDQLLMLRPVPGAAQYATPINGLFLCGAGTHPGGGVMGAAGMNAAGQVIAGKSVRIAA